MAARRAALLLLLLLPPAAATGLASSSAARQPGPRCAPACAAPSTAPRLVVNALTLLQQQQPGSGSNVSLPPLLVGAAGAPAGAVALLVSGTLLGLDPAAATCLAGVAVRLAFSRRVRVAATNTAGSAATGQWTPALPGAFRATCLGLGVDGPDSRGGPSRPCGSAAGLRFDDRGALLLLSNLTLCPSCWLVGGGSGGAFWSWVHRDGLEMETAGAVVGAASCEG